MLKRLIVIACILGTWAQAKNLTVALAANVSYAINDIQKAFNQKHPDIKLRIILGSSGKLTAQIQNGAPYDIFMAANMKYPQSLYDSGKAITNPIVYAQGALAMLSKKEQEFTKGLNLLLDSKIDKIAIANPKTAPYGKASIDAFKSAKIYENIKSKLIYAESISQTVSYTITAADIGLIAASSLYSDKMQKYQKNRHWVAVDTTLYEPINQGIVILKRAKVNKDAKAFYDFILSDEAKVILKKYGYIVP
ncbi:MAG: molybdate ABC transporter substrate-binding protein [Campylobacterota bacterium]|nr:molybdate ABC transporter substrate-binding protein [Campylobacterota bacterium]